MSGQAKEAGTASSELAGREMVEELARLVDEMQGEDMVAIDVSGMVSYTDYLLICTARNERLADAIHDRIYEHFKHELGTLPSVVEGLPQASWILMDYPDCVVHIFVPETRDRYRLDQLWGEGPVVELAVGDGTGPAGTDDTPAA